MDLYYKEFREEILRGVWLTLKIMKQVYGLKRKKCLKLCHYLLLHTEIAGFTDESDFGVVGSDRERLVLDDNDIILVYTRGPSKLDGIGRNVVSDQSLDRFELSIPDMTSETSSRLEVLGPYSKIPSGLSMEVLETNTT